MTKPAGSLLSLAAPAETGLLSSPCPQRLPSGLPATNNRAPFRPVAERGFPVRLCNHARSTVVEDARKRIIVRVKHFALHTPSTASASKTRIKFAVEETARSGSFAGTRPFDATPFSSSLAPSASFNSSPPHDAASNIRLIARTRARLPPPGWRARPWPGRARLRRMYSPGLGALRTNPGSVITTQHARGLGRPSPGRASGTLKIGELGWSSRSWQS